MSGLGPKSCQNDDQSTGTGLPMRKGDESKLESGRHEVRLISAAGREPRPDSDDDRCILISTNIDTDLNRTKKRELGAVRTTSRPRTWKDHR